jgi:hypothetical protein
MKYGRKMLVDEDYDDYGAIEGVGVMLYVIEEELEEWKHFYSVLEYTVIKEFWVEKSKDMYANDFVMEYFNKKNELKKTNPQLSELYKLIINSSIGKWGQDKDKVNLMINFKNHQHYYEIGRKESLMNDMYSFSKVKSTRNKRHNYILNNIVITAMGRVEIMKKIRQFGSIYCDTDSIKTLQPLPDNEVDNTNLGGLKFEHKLDQFKYLQCKTYISIMDGEYDVKCCGLYNECRNKLNMTNFKMGKIIKGGKRLKKIVNGGLVIYNTDFEIGATRDIRKDKLEVLNHEEA